MRSLFVVGAVASSLLALSSAAASDRLFRIDQGSLDDSYGVQTVLGRIDAFAEGRCIDSGRVGLWARRGQDACLSQVRASLISQIGDERLASAAHARYAQDF